MRLSAYYYRALFHKKMVSVSHGFQYSIKFLKRLFWQLFKPNALLQDPLYVARCHVVIVDQELV